MSSAPSHRDESTASRPEGQRLSCLLDGDAQGLSIDELCAAWRDDPQCRTTWHRWHLIGDVMRSSELASPPGRDVAFVERLRERLAAEPPLLAPAPLKPPARQPRLGWRAPAAVAAGFVAVAGVVVAVRVNEPAAPAAALAASGAAAQPVAAARPNPLLRASSSGSAAVPAAPTAVDAAMLRDAEIDRYFRAHRGFTASPAMPGGAPRNVDTIVQR